MTLVPVLTTVDGRVSRSGNRRLSEGRLQPDRWGKLTSAAPGMHMHQ
jgi:hypothetical protein